MENSLFASKDRRQKCGNGNPSELYSLFLLFRSPANRTTKNAVGTVARIRNTSVSFFALANAITIPKIPTAKKYHLYPFFILFSIEVLMCCRVFVRRVPALCEDATQPTRLTWKSSR